MFIRTFVRRVVQRPAPPMSEACTSFTSALSNEQQLTTDQLNSTALKWGEDGELSDLDLQRILRLLSQADPVAEALLSSADDSNL
jgi:hypothetical protein